MFLPLLSRGAIGLSIDFSDRQLDQFEKYYHLLVDWNTRFNLTSVTEYDAVQTIHFLDSLTVVLAGIDFDGKRVIDVGSGAGFPGLPLKIAFPSIDLTLLEATGKKATFLTEAAAALELSGVTILNARAEDAAQQPEHRGKYDLVLSRAVASLNTLCELCLPFCQVGGTFIAMKKGEIYAEIKSAVRAIETLGGFLQSSIDVQLGELLGARKLVIVNKIAPTPPGFPRRNGLPAQKPLR